MTQARSAKRRSLALVCAASLGATGLTTVVTGPAALAAPATELGHDRVVSAVPKAETPNIQNESVNAIYDAGDKIITVGRFTKVKSAGTEQKVLPRERVFAFDEDTGAVDKDFIPDLDADAPPDPVTGEINRGEVHAVIGGPTSGTVYIAGRFGSVNLEKRSKVALLNVSDGSVVASFKPPAINGAVTDIKLVGDHLLLAGSFTNLGGKYTRNGLASLNATTGALDDYLTVSLTENHGWTEGSVGMAKAPVGAEKLAVSPDGSQMVAIGNFKKANGEVHDQVVKINLGEASATVADWNTERYQAVCTPTKFDSYVRDVAFSPDGEFFVIVGTGAAVAGTLCDAAARWEADATGGGHQPTWVSYTGGDTLLSVAISEQAVYIGGHQRWANNDLASNMAKPGAVARPGIAALDPAGGAPLAWNPGRHPRGVGAAELYLTPQGLWVGSDQEYIGNKEYKHDRIAFFPLAGGEKVASTATESLPGDMYALGKNAPSAALLRVNVGGEAIAAADGGPNWQADTAEAPIRYHNAGLTATAGRYWIPTVKAPVSVSTPREIFNSDRLASPTARSQAWDIPIAKGTAISVRLYFASRCSTCVAGTRVFHINVDGIRKATNFDIYAQAGGNDIGIMRGMSIVSDGNVDIDLLQVAGYSSLSAIEIYRNPVPAALGTENYTYRIPYDGNTTVGNSVQFANPDNYTWQLGRGGFMVGDKLYYGHGDQFYRRTFNGTTFGAAEFVNPYSDPKWDTVVTESEPAGQTYAGMPTDFYKELPSVTGMFYDSGWLYYTIAGHAALYKRAFTPDSGVVGAVRIAGTHTVSFANSGGVFVSDGSLYTSSRITGNLAKMSWSNGTPGETATMVSGPTVDGKDWRTKVLFVGP